MKATQVKFNNAAIEFNDRIVLLVNSRSYFLDGDWKLARNADKKFTFAGLVAKRITFNFLVDIREVNYVIHPDDVRQVLLIIDGAVNVKPGALKIRIISPDGVMHELSGEGTFVGRSTPAEDEARIHDAMAWRVEQRKLHEINTALEERVVESTSQLQAEHKRFKEAQSIGHVGSFEWITSSDKIYWSDEMYRIHGLEPQSEEITLEKFKAFLHPDERDWMNDEIRISRSEVVKRSVIHRIIRADKTVAYIHRHWESFADRTGKIVRVSGTCQDVTEITESNREIKEQSHFIASVIETVPDMISVIDLSDRQVEFVNRGQFLKQGFSPDELKKLTKEERHDIVFEDDRSVVDEYFRRFDSLDDDVVNTVDYRAVNSNGELMWFRAHGKVFRRDESGNATHCVNVVQNITTYKHSQDELFRVKEQLARKAQDKYRLLFDAINEGFCIVQVIFDDAEKPVDFRFVETNPAFEEIMRLADVNGRTIREVVPSIEQHWIDVLGDVAVSGEAMRFDHYSEALNNRWFNVYASITGPRNSGLVAILLSDTTSLHQAEKKVTIDALASDDVKSSRSLLDDQNRHLQKVLDAISQMVWILDPTGKIWFVNDRWHTYTGITSEQCLESEAPKCDIFHPSQKKEIIAKWNDLFSKKERHVSEVLIRNEKGRYRWHLDIMEPIFDKDGNVEIWVGTFTDVHDEFIREREAKTTRDLLEAAFNSTTSGIALFDSEYDESGYLVDFTLKYSNEQSRKFAAPDLTEGKSLSSLSNKSRAEWLINALRAVVESGETSEFDLQVDRDDAEVWLHIVAVKLEDGVVVTSQDITDRVKAKQNLLKLNDALKEKNQELKTKNEQLANFTFISSHDLREPLRKIQLFASQLSDKTISGVNEKGVVFATKILSAVNRMNDLIEDVLTYSKASVSARSNARDTDLNEVLLQVLSEMSETIRDRDAVITQNKLPLFKCNALQMSQLIQNLISNALKFQPGNRQPAVSVHGQIISGDTIDSPLINSEMMYLKLEVSDNGIGFEQEYAEKIFGIFQRLHNRNVFSGTGMGLAICKKVVENHKGFILARGLPGEGATFTCYLPVIE